VLHGMYKTRSRAVLALVAAILLAIQFEAWNVRIISGYYMWMTPTWLACYLLAMRWSEAVDVAPVPAVAET